MPQKRCCEELNRIQLEAIAALHAAKNTRRSRDLSFHEDVELTRDEHQKIDALLKHLLAGHDGHPCPAGDRPIIGIAPAPAIAPSDLATPSFRPLALLQRRR
ncbi:MAG: hypothetical protein WB987_07190 [Candidatus Acidiferrales bacterium]